MFCNRLKPNDAIPVGKGTRHRLKSHPMTALELYQETGADKPRLSFLEESRFKFLPKAS